MIELPQEIEQIPVEKLIPYARNSRTHDDAQTMKLILGSMLYERSFLVWNEIRRLKNAAA